MTREEAIEILEANRPDPCYQMLREAVDFAVDALKAQGTCEDAVSRQTLQKELALYPIDDVTTEDEAGYNRAINDVQKMVLHLPSVQTDVPDTNVGDNDLISRSDAIDAVDKLSDEPIGYLEAAIDALVDLPSAQPEPMSDAYMKAVWTWLLDYQIKVAELKGRYTPYEVLSWVANDWRKEHEQRSDKQTGGD